MKLPNEKLAQDILSLEKARTVLINKVKKYSMGINVGTCMIVVSVIMLAYYLVVIWHSETYRSVWTFPYSF